MDIVTRKIPCFRSIFSRLLRTPTPKLEDKSSSQLKTQVGESTTTPEKRLVIESLSERELISVQGKEVIPFLQGLITNDVNQLMETSSLSRSKMTGALYALFLNKSGRVLYDTIIYRTKDPNTLLVECDKNVANDLRRHLRMYRVRRDIKVEPAYKEFKPWVIFNPDEGSDAIVSTARLPSDVISATDPRYRNVGIRLVANPDNNWSDIAKLFTTLFDKINVKPSDKECNYKKHRYFYGIGEGIEDLPPGKCFPLEANCDFLNGISFQKGCYIGQELTARVHHTGVIRKRLMPIRLTKHVAGNTQVQTQAGFNVGTLRGFNENRGLALLRVEQALNAEHLIIDGEVCYVEKPNWWPADLAIKSKGAISS